MCIENSKVQGRVPPSLPPSLPLSALPSSLSLSQILLIWAGKQRLLMILMCLWSLTQSSLRSLINFKGAFKARFEGSFKGNTGHVQDLPTLGGLFSCVFHLN